MAKFDWIVNKLKERIYPYTHADAVIMDDDGTKLSGKFTSINEHIEDAVLHVPSGGNVGQVLTKTANGNNWATVSSSGEGGTTDYTLLNNLPKINDVTVVGNKSSNDLGITASSIGVEEGANNYIHPTTSGNKHIPSGGSSGKVLKWSDNGTAIWETENNIPDASITESGLMSAQDKLKVDKIPNLIYSTVVPDELPENTICFVYE